MQTKKLSWLKVLLLEDLPQDAFLIERELQKHVVELEFVTTKSRDEFGQLIDSFSPHIILADYNLPKYSGMEALFYVQSHSIITPFIFVTNTLANEELAAETILNGANGFVLKNNLDKLGPLVVRLMNEPQINTPFELASRLWICQYQTSMVAKSWTTKDTPHIGAENIVAESNQMFLEAQEMLNSVRQHLDSNRIQILNAGFPQPQED